MIDETTFLEILIDEMPIELPCTTPGCASGVGGATYKTPALEADIALKMLDRHRADVHGVQGGGGGGGAAEGGKKIQLSKIPRPSIAGGCSQEDFKFFKRSWDQYIRASNETGDVALRDSCSTVQMMP